MEVTDYCFSFFRKPIQNTEPLRAIGIVDVYRYVVGHYARPQTEALRSMVSPADAKRYKAAHFDYCTFSGLFRKRNEKELIMHSGLMCLDFDHVEDMESVKQQLLNHDYYQSFRKRIEMDYTCGFERMGALKILQGCCQLCPCYGLANGGYVGKRRGACLFPASRPTSIY